METVIRNYAGKGAAELMNLLEQRADDVRAEIGKVKGLIWYALVRTDDGGFSVTVCEDKVGIDESVQLAREWIATHGYHIDVASPQVTSGKVILSID